MSKGVEVEFKASFENDIYLYLTQNNIKKGKIEIKLNIHVEDFPRDANGNVLKYFSLETLNYSILNDKQEINAPKTPLTLIYKDIQDTEFKDAIKKHDNWTKK